MSKQFQVNLSEIKLTGCKHDHITDLNDQTVRWKVESNMNQDNQRGHKVEAAMNVGTLNGVTFTPHFGLNLDGKGDKSLQGVNYGLDMAFGDFKSFVHVKNGNNCCVGNCCSHTLANQFNLKTVFDTGNESGNFESEFKFQKGFDQSKEAKEGEEEGKADKCCHTNSNTDVMTMGVEGNFELTDDMKANVSLQTEKTNGEETRENRAELKLTMDDAQLKFCAKQTRGGAQELVAHLKNKFDLGDDNTITPFLKMCVHQEGEDRHQGFGGGWDATMQLGGNTINHNLEACVKGEKKTVKFGLDTDLEGPFDGSTLTPFVGAKWCSESNHVHTHAGLRFKSSLSQLGELLGN